MASCCELVGRTRDSFRQPARVDADETRRELRLGPRRPAGGRCSFRPSQPEVRTGRAAPVARSVRRPCTAVCLPCSVCRNTKATSATRSVAARSEPTYNVTNASQSSIISVANSCRSLIRGVRRTGGITCFLSLSNNVISAFCIAICCKQPTGTASFVSTLHGAFLSYLLFSNFELLTEFQR